jgi:hypothetical protein
MKTTTTLLVLLALVAPALQGFASLEPIRAELKSLKSIDGWAVGYAGMPGRFYLLCPYCVTYGDEETLSSFLKDENPIVAAMGALCIMDRYPRRTKEIMQLMKSDHRSVEVLPGGCGGLITNMQALFEKIEGNPDYIVPMRFRGQPVHP